MMIFLIICAQMLLAALLFVVLPLWRGSSKMNPVQRDNANLEIFRDQVAEMDADLRNGLLSVEMYEQGKRELQSRLLDEVGEAKVAGTSVMKNPLKTLAIVLSVVLPLIAAGIYWKVGNQQALLQQSVMAGANQGGIAQSDSSLKELEGMVTAKPEDPNGWFHLARSYSELGRYADAARAYDRLTTIVPDEAQLWADYADVLAMSAGRTLIGKPAELLDKALALDAKNFKALALSGSAAMERGDFKTTVRHWESLLKLLPPDDENTKVIKTGIQQARILMAQKTAGQSTAQPPRAAASSGAAEAITGTVVLSEQLKGRASPEDTLFVLVRAAQGPKMPLAIVRKQVKDLPFKFTLDDSTAMSPQMKLSNFDQVVVVARVSKSGNAMTQPGDLHGTSATIKPGSKGIKLSIDAVAP